MTEWIPTSERLPELKRKVLITIEEPDRTFVTIGKAEFGMTIHLVYWKANGTRYDGNMVKAWMYLPKPYGVKKMVKYCEECKYAEPNITIAHTLCTNKTMPPWFNVIVFEGRVACNKFVERGCEKKLAEKESRDEAD